MEEDNYDEFGNYIGPDIPIVSENLYNDDDQDDEMHDDEGSDDGEDDIKISDEDLNKQIKLFV